MKLSAIPGRWAVVLGLLLLLIVHLVLSRIFLRPEITALDRLIAGPGDTIEISGRHFGRKPEKARLYAGTGAIMSTAIVEWEKNRIRARIPANDGAVLVRVKTRYGTSNGVILGDASRFPDVDYGAWVPGAPFIEYADPPEGHAGSRITFHGSGFGNKQGSGRIWVNRSDENPKFGMEKPDVHSYAEAAVIELWSDSLVTFRVPEGVRSGYAYLQRSGIFSNPVSIEVGEVPGVMETGNPVQWSLHQKLVVDRIGAFPGNALYLRLPSPQSGAGQSEPLVLLPPAGCSSPCSLVREDEGLALYRLEELKPGDSVAINRQIVVSVAPVRVQVNPSGFIARDKENPAFSAFLGRDEWIRPAEVSAVAARAARGFRNDWSRSRALYNYVTSRLEWIPDAPDISAAEAVKTRQGNSRTYSFLFCSLARAAGVPARPVGGLIVLENGESRRWWWAEFWLEGVGWVPVDPALADSTGQIRLPGGPQEDESALEYYFGGLEGRHIAFSRGIRVIGTVQPGPISGRPDEPYSLQAVWEEASGNLESYTCSWSPPVVTAQYGM